MDANGRELDSPTSFFIGAALNMNAPDLSRELRVLERKVEAGAHFLLTQPVYSAESVARVESLLGGFPLPVIMGVLPLRSVRHARFLHNEAPGIEIPPDVMERMERAADAAAEGIAIAQELLTAAAERVSGAYFMPPFERYSIVGRDAVGAVAAGRVGGRLYCGERALRVAWGRSSVGRAPALQAGSQGFESPRLHHRAPLLDVPALLPPLPVGEGRGGGIRHSCEGRNGVGAPLVGALLPPPPKTGEGWGEGIRHSCEGRNLAARGMA